MQLQRQQQHTQLAVQSNKFASEDTEVFAATVVLVEAEASDLEASTVAVPVFMVDITERTAFLETVASVGTISSTSLLEGAAHFMVTNKALSTASKR